jgi:VCBS repeat-containing protein
MKAFRLLSTILFFGATALVFSQNNPPVITQNISITVDENGTASTVDLSEFVTDADSDPLEFSIVQYGASQRNKDGSLDGTFFTYTHNGGESATDVITFSVQDKNGDTVLSTITGTINVEINPINDVPTLTTQNIPVEEGGVFEGTLAGFDAESAALAYVIHSQPSKGRVDFENGKFIYTHDGSEGDSDRFTIKVYEVSNPSSFSTTDFDVAITAVNDAPTAEQIEATVSEGSSKPFGFSFSNNQDSTMEGYYYFDSDSGESDLKFRITQNPLNGTATVSGTTITYAHNGSETTTDSFQYEVSDGSLSSKYTVAISVSPVNDSPIGTDDIYFIASNETEVSVNAEVGVLQNDSDSENQDLTAMIATDPANGVVSLQADGSFIYTANNAGITTDSFTYTVSDDSGASSESVTVTIEAASVRPAPEAYTLDEGGVLEVPADFGILLNDIDSNDLDFSASIINQPEYGILSLNDDGSFTYTHDGSENLIDRFTYNLTNANGDESKATFVKFSINNINDAPTAGTTSVSLLENGSIAFVPNYNDSDNDQSEVVFALQESDQSTNAGSFQITQDGFISYTHNGSEVFTDTFSYTVSDGEFTTEPALVKVTILPVNDAPVIDNESLTISLDEGASVSQTVTVLDSESDDTRLVKVQGAAASHGSVELSGNTITYTHFGTPDFTDTFSLQAFDGVSYGEIKEFTVTVNSVNDAPELVDSATTTYNVDEEGSVIVPISTLFFDEEGDSISYTISTEPTNGSVTLVDGVYTYTHDGSETLSDQFEITATDGAENSNTEQIIKLSINAVNDAPVFDLTKFSNLSVDQYDELLITPKVDDEDNANVTLTATKLSGNGSLIDNEDGSFTLIDENTGDASEESFSILFAASDDEFTIEETVAISVIDIDETKPSVILRTNQTSVTEGDQITVLASLIKNDFYSRKRDLPQEYAEFFTYIGQYNGHKYYKYDGDSQQKLNNNNYRWDNMRYSSAENLAKLVGGYPLVVETSEEAEELRTLINSDYNVWLGYTYDGAASSYKWINGSTSAAGVNWSNTSVEGYPRSPEDNQVVYFNTSSKNFENVSINNNHQVIVEFDQLWIPESDVSFIINTGGSAILGAEADYTGVQDGQQITITAGSVEEQSIVINTRDDEDDESQESLTLTVPSAAASESFYIRRSQSNLSFNIDDNDATGITFLVNGVEGNEFTVNEGDGDLVISMNLDNPKAYETSVQFTLSDDDDSPVIGEDFDSKNTGYVDYLLQDLEQVRGLTQVADKIYYIGRDRQIFVYDTNTQTATALNTSNEYGNPETTNSYTFSYDNVRFQYLRDLTSDSNGNIYVLDDWYIRKIDTTTERVGYVVGSGTWSNNPSDGTGAEAQFASPRQIAVNSDGSKMYLFDRQRLREITYNNSGDAVLTTVAGNGDWGQQDGSGQSVRFGNVEDMEVASNGDVYLADDGSLRKYSNGSITTVKRIYEQIGGLDIDANGDIYFSTRWSNQLYKYEVENDRLILLIDSRDNSGIVNGPLNEAKISSPEDVLFTSAGELLFTEPNSQQIRKIDFINKVRIKSGETKGIYTLTIKDDNLYESDEVLTLTPTSPSGIDLTGVNPIQITIQSDDSLPEVQVVASKEVVRESEESVTFTVQLGNASEASSKSDIDASVAGQYTFIGDFNGSKYYMSNNYYSWEQAKTEAESLGGSLAVINSLEENEFIRSNSGNNSKWIGYSDRDQEGSFEWANGSSSDFTNWASGEPNNAGDEDYAEFMSNGKWNDLPRWNNLPYIVEFSGVKSSVDTQVTLAIDAIDNSATQGDEGDYVAADNLTLTIPAGENKASVSFTINDDLASEPAEYIQVSIVDTEETPLVNGIKSTTNGVARVEILDNEPASVTLATSASKLSENGESIIVTTSTEFAKQTETAVVLEVNQSGTDTAIENRDFFIPELDQITTIAGSSRGYSEGSKELARFNSNQKMARLGNQGFLIADPGNNVVRLLKDNGEVSTYIGNGNYRHNENYDGVDRTEVALSGPHDIAINRSGEIFILESNQNAISKIGTDGKYKLIANSNGNWGSDDNDNALQASFNNPRAIAFDTQENLYVADGENRIRKITFSGNSASVTTYAGTGQWGGQNGDRLEAQFQNPMDLVIDEDDNIYVAEHNRIRKINAQGQVSTFAGEWWGDNDGSFQTARFRNPSALAFDSNGNILVTDDDSSSLRIIYMTGDKEGQVETLIGNKGSGFADGVFSSAKLNRPRGVIATASKILVSDSDNNRIRQISLEPTIIIPAGETSGSITLSPIDDYRFENDESLSLSVVSTSNVSEESSLDDLAITLISDDAAPMARLMANTTSISESSGSAEFSVRLSDAYSSVKPDMEPSKKANYYFLGEFEGSYYYSSKQNGWTSYPDAKRIAESLGGTLAIISSQKENDFITEKIFEKDPDWDRNNNRWLAHWIGYAYDESGDGGWKWNNGQEFDYSNWQGDGYLNTPENRPYTTLHENGQWDNRNKNDHQRYIIEFSGASTDVDTTVALSLALADGASEDDYTTTASETITVPAGSYKSTFTVTAVDDERDEALESLTLSISAIENSGVTIDEDNRSVSLGINDNDITTATIVSTASESISEAGGAYAITAELFNPKPYAVSIDLAFDSETAGSATFGLDFNSPSLNKTSTIAGTGSYGFVDGDASIAQFESDIRAMVADKDGNLYIADSNRSVIRKYDKAQNRVSTFVGNPNGGGDVNEGDRSEVRVGYVRGMASDTINERIYFFDDWTRLVRSVDLNSGQVSFVAGDGSWNGGVDGSGMEASFQNITAMTADSNGDVYFIDGTQLRKIDITEGADAVVTTLAGQFNNGGEEDGFGDQARISWGDHRGMAIDLEGNVVFTDGGRNRVRKYNVITGEVTTIAGQWWDYADGVGTNARFKNPSGLAITSNGDIYVSDSEDKRIRKIVQQENGSYIVSTIAGTGKNGYQDGVASSSEFGNPLYLAAFGKQLALFDQGNAVIRQIQLTPTIKIPAGQTTGSFEVTAINDVVYETDEQIIVSASVASGATLTGDSTFSTTLVSDDNIPIVALQADNSILKENGGSLEVKVSLLDEEGSEVIWEKNDLSDEVKNSFNFLGEFEGHKYYQSFNRVDFNTANSIAQSLGAQLLIINSQAENDFIGRTIREGVWVAVTWSQELGSWVPLYGESDFYNFENPGQTGDSSQYAATYGNTWYNHNSNDNFTYVLEFGPTKSSGLDTVITLAIAGTASVDAQSETEPADYRISTTEVTIPAGESSAIFTVNAEDDGLDEAIETVEVSIQEIATYAEQAVATISEFQNSFVIEIDDDEAPKVTFDLSSTSLVENKGTTTLKATLSNPKVSDTQIQFNFAGEATFLDDYRSSDLGLVETIAGVYKGSGFVNGTSDVARFNAIWGMAAYTDGSYLLVDRDNNAIRKLNADGSVENFIGNGNGWGNEVGLRTSVSVNRPSYLDVDDNYNVYFATQNNKIYKYNIESDRVEIIAGNGQYSFADGVGQSSSFRNPFDIEVNSDGSIIYVLDFDNRNIRVLTRGEDGIYTVSSLTNGNNGGNDNLVTGSFEDAKLGRPYEIEVDWEENKIYAISAIEWGYGAMLVLDLNTNTVGSTVIATDNGSWRYWGFDVDESNNFYLTDAQNRTIVKMNLGKPGVDRYTDEETGWIFQSHQNDIFKFYRLMDNPSIIEAVVEYTFSSGSTIRFGGFEDGETYGIQSNETVITNTYDYFRHFEPGVYRIQINTDNLTYSISSTSDVPTRGYTLSTIAGGERGYADATGNEAKFEYPSSILVDGSNALVYDDNNEVLRSVRVQTALIVEGRSLTSSVDFIAHKDQYFEGDEIIDLSVSNFINGYSETTTFDPITITDATRLTRIVDAPFEGVQDGKVSWGDYDRDGDMDLLLMGSGTEGTITNIYRNNNGVFENTNQNFTKFLGGDAEFVDVDQDGWLDVALSGNSPKGRVSELYINRGEDSPTAPYFQLSTNYVVEGLSQSDMEWGDLDNDGDPDLIISGINSENQYRSIYYTNLGNYTFLEENFFNRQGRIQAEIDMFDSDNDGDLDVGIAGVGEGDNFGYEFITNSYYGATPNYDANYNFNNYQWLREGKTMFLDLDVDSRVDYFAMGLDENRNIQQRSNLGVSLNPLSNPDFAFADYNNDGLNDVVITGEDEQGNPVTKLYVTLGGIEFGYRLYETDIDLVALRESTVDWIDYDLDGDLDLFMTGIDDTGVPISVLYEANNVANLNEAPSKISNLSAVHAGNGLVQFNWDKPSDNANTEFRYSLRVGTSPGASDVLYVNATETGTRLIDEPALSTLNSRELILNPGTYYAAVQAIDAGNSGGEFSDEIQFTVDYSWKRLNLGGIIDRSLRPNAGSQIEFVDYDGDGDMDLIGSNVGTDYTWNGSAINIFGFENGVFVPKQQEGGGSTTFGLGDLNKNGFVDIVYAQEEQSGSRIHPAFNMQPIINEASSNGEDVGGILPYRNGYNFNGDNLIPSLYDAKVAIKDLDNDGMPEVILAGASSQIESEATAAVYLLRMNLNDGETELQFDNFYFTYEKLIENNARLEGLSFLSFDLGDVDGDSDYDLLFTGFGFDGYQTILFENTGDLEGELFLETDNNFIAVREGSASFIDIDGDGLLDVVFSGQSGDGDTFKVYKNTGNIQNFAALEVGLPSIRKSAVDFGDFNEDGYYDILYSGTIQGEGRTTRLAEYDPTTRTFVDSAFDVSKYLDASVGFGDFDGDGDLDFVLSGEEDNDDLGQIRQIADVFINVRDLAPAENSRLSLAKEGNNSGLGAPTISAARRRRVAENSYEVTVEWDGAKNKEGNPDSALTYELKVGTSKNGNEVLSTIANAEGVRALATSGNAESNTSWKLNLPEGTYFAQVQAVDASYQGSKFSDIFEFAVVNSFRLGDANGDDVVNVLDLTTNIEYIMTGIEPTAFVPEVADVNLDGSINVTDISGIVEIILNPETSTSRIALSKAVDKSDYFSNKVVGDAELALQNGEVKLRSNREVVALQFSVNKDAAIRMNDRLASNFNVVSFERNNRIHYLIYSLNNQDILGVTDQLFTVSGNTKLDVSDLAANTAGVGTLSIEFLDESYLDQYNNGAVFYPNPAREVASLYVGLENAVRVQVELFNMQGSPVLQYATERNVDQINLNVSNLSSGLYAARIQITTEDGRIVTRSLKLVIQ